MFIGIFLLVSTFVVAILFIGSYNALVSLKQQLERTWSNIDVVLKQRYDEIPQLIQVIKQYVQYEADMIEKVVSARKNYSTAESIGQKIEASQQLSLALKGVIAIGEAYPELKANQNFVQLQSRISNLEGQIADRRETYNDAVANFNTRIAQFPDAIAARILNYQEQKMFTVLQEEKSIPSLDMNLPNAKKTSA